MKMKIKRIAAWLLVVLLLSGCGVKAQPSSVSLPPDSEPISVSETDTCSVSETDTCSASETDIGSASETASVPSSETTSASITGTGTTTEQETSISEEGSYTTKEQVALYLHTYGHLPANYITKKEAQDLGWDSKQGNLNEIAPGKSIGGSHFGNYEGLLPEKSGRKYFECDIDYDGGYRGSKRLIYSNDGLIFYTEDHYQTFEQLY